MPTHGDARAQRPPFGLVAGLTVGALAVRLVGIGHGLPFAFNPDEELHFVPAAVEAADGDLNPNYFDNPSALTYVLALAIRIGAGTRDATDWFAAEPTTVYLISRVAVAVLGTIAVPLTYLAAAGFVERRAAVFAAAFIGFSFLPVYYSHQALNDVVTLAPVAGAVWCVGATLRQHSPRFLIGAGALVGTAAATKYTAATLSLAVAVTALSLARDGRWSWATALRGLVVAGVACIAVFLALNPFLVMDVGPAVHHVLNQSSDAAVGKLGQTGSGWSYYPRTLAWGLGLVASLLAALGLVLVARSRLRDAVVLAVFPLALYLLLADQGRFFGRWMLPAYPILAILAGHGLATGTAWVTARIRPHRRLARLAATGAIVLLGFAQPAYAVARSDLVLLHTDTRLQAHRWLAAELPPGTGVVVEPGFPVEFWAARSDVDVRPVRPPYQEYEASLEPDLLDAYRLDGFCWVVVTSHQRERGEMAGLRAAAAYYRRLEAESSGVARFSPYREGATAQPFSFDLSFNWYSPSFERPGPIIEVRRLADCAPQQPSKRSD